MKNWKRSEFATRVGFGNDIRIPAGGMPAIIGKADVDPATRGIVATIAHTMLDEFGSTGNIQIKYWYRRPNGQSSFLHLIEVQISQDEENDETVIDEIYYREKPLLSHLRFNSLIRQREVLLDATKEIILHLREGGFPNKILKILNDYNIEDIIGEKIVLPGQDADGNFSFNLSDTFNRVAKGDVCAINDPALIGALATGEINTLDSNRTIETAGRSAFATDKTNGSTFKGNVRQNISSSSRLMQVDLNPVFTDSNNCKSINLLKLGWKKTNAIDGDNFVLKGFRFLNKDISNLDSDTQIKILGASYRVMDLFRKRKYPTALDILHEFDLLDLFSPIKPPQPEGRFSVISLLGNGKDEIVEGFGFDLGACKAVCFEKISIEGNVRREIVILDLGKMLAPENSSWDGALPDVISLLNDTKAIFITHRHLDHMAGIIELTRLGLLKGIRIYGAPRVLYILKNQLRAELDDKSCIPDFCEISGESIEIFKNIRVEYCVDGMDHSTASTIYRAVGITDEGKIKGSYLFYGDGRDITKPEFLKRGLRSFGLDRQDTLHDLDLTNAKKPGKCPTENDAQKNLVDLMNCFGEKGIITGLISTNDRRLQTLYRVFNKVKRNFTAVGHNVEMSLRAHNIYGVDPEYIKAADKDNVNEFLKIDAAENDLNPVEFRSRGSCKAKAWLQGDLGRLGVLVTGTQGNPGEMFSTLYRFSEGWSTLDADRNTSFKIDNPKKWVVIIDQSAIPGNHKHQKKMISRLIRNRSVHCVAVAIDDGLKVYGLEEKAKSEFIKKYIKDDRKYYIDDDGSLVVTGAPLHPSGHGYMEDIAHIAVTANADINHGTHTNDPENTTRFHVDICEKNGLRHVGRQFDDFEHNEIEMGETPQQSRVESLGHSHSSIIVFKIVREFGKFFGGTLRAKKITKLDAKSGFAQHGIFGESGFKSFEHDVVRVDFAKAAKRRVEWPDDGLIPESSMMTDFIYERRYKGVSMPMGVRMDKKKISQIRNIAAKMAA